MKIKCLLILLLIAGGLFPSTFVHAATFQKNGEKRSAKELEALASAYDDEKIYLGDIIIYRRTLGRKIEPFAGFGGALWPGGRFIFEFNGQSDDEQQVFLDACDVWTEGTGLQCIERTDEASFARITTHDGSGCGGNAENVSCSAIGMVGGAQNFEVYSSHWNSPDVIIHEIGHAIGLVHEHQRSDRNKYIVINKGNILAGKAGQFDRWNETRNLTDYDYNSIMHYDNCLFAREEGKCRPISRSTEPYWTISPAPCAFDEVGGGATVTALDLDGARAAYGGAVLSIFRRQRSSECGTHRYSKAQVTTACGANCTHATPLAYNRKHEKYRKGCGFIPVFNPQRYCVGRQQEYIDDWWDEDYGALECWGGTRIEHWTLCGCSIQTLTAKCSQIDDPIDSVALKNVLENGTLRERNLAKLIAYVEELGKNGSLDDALMQAKNEVYFSLAVSTSIYEAKLSGSLDYMSNSPEQFEEIIEYIVCELKILKNIYDTLNRKIGTDEFSAIIGKRGLDIPEVLSAA